MNLLPEWLTSLGQRRAEPVDEPDFADMGTAFGLDASMAPKSVKPVHVSRQSRREPKTDPPA